MTARLPKDLQDALHRTPPEQPLVVDDDADTRYAIIRLDVFQQLKQLTGEGVPTSVEQTPSAARGGGSLPDWCNVYDGLTDDEIEDVEAVILNRSDLSRPE